MKAFKEIWPEDFTKSPFQVIGKDWMLITAERDGKVNTMTASWGGFGVMWSKNVVFVVIRPQRYTKEFVDKADTFSITVLDNSYRKLLGYLGSVSGRNEDKIGKSGLTVEHLDGTPYFKEGEFALICKKLYAQEYRPECFIDSELDAQWYPEKDRHTMYIAEVQKILVKEEVD